MMTRIPKRQATSSRFIPVALLISLALAVGVWIIPMPFLRVEQKDIAINRQANPGATTENDETQAGTVKTSDWLALRASLSEIRKPPPTEDEINTEEDPTEDEGEDDPRAAQGEHLPPISWRYVGYIAQPNGRLVAAMEIDGVTRLLYAGAQIEDTVDPRGRTIRVKDVTRAAVTLERVGRDIVLDLESRSDQNDEVYPDN